MTDYDRIAAVIRFIDQHRSSQPEIEQLAAVAGLSGSHFHRLFQRWAGVTPKSFLKCLTLNHARQQLRAGRSVLDAALDAGLSGPGRLHDLTVSLTAASPGEIKSGGQGWVLRAGFAETPFGVTLIAQSPRGICHLSFVAAVCPSSAELLLREDWPNARIEWDDDLARNLMSEVFARHDQSPHTAARLSCLVRGTTFQVRVWNALLSIPSGHLAAYCDIASFLGRPNAARAIGSAVGKNPVALLIPCHRVIRETGVFGDYRWGPHRKQAIIAWESTR